MQAVWGDLAVTDDSLVQCIHEIRRALDDGGRSLLRTVPRRGYRLVVPGERRRPSPRPVARGAAVRHRRRPGAGLLRRRPRRGPDHQPLEESPGFSSSRATRRPPTAATAVDIAQGGRRSRRALPRRGQRPPVGRPPADQRAAGRRRLRRPCLGRQVRRRRRRTSSTCRTSWPSRSSAPSSPRSAAPRSSARGASGRAASTPTTSTCGRCRMCYANTRRGRRRGAAAARATRCGSIRATSPPTATPPGATSSAISAAGFDPADRAAALAHADIALGVNADDPQAMSIAAFVRANLTRDYDGAIPVLDRALAMNGNSALAFGFSALVSAHSERHERAVEHAGRALRLSPFDDPLNYHPYCALALTNLFAGRFEDAVRYATLTIRANPGFSVAYAYLVAGPGRPRRPRCRAGDRAPAARDRAGVLGRRLRPDGPVPPPPDGGDHGGAARGRACPSAELGPTA